MPERALTALIIGLEPDILAHRRGEDLNPLEVFTDQTQLDPADTLDAIVVGPVVKDQIRSAQEMHLRYPDAGVLIAVRPDERDRLRRALGFAPSIPADIDIADVTDADLAERVLLTATHAAARRAHRSVLAAVMGAAAAPARPSTRSAPSLGTVLDHAPVGVLMCDTDGGLLSWNARAAQMLQADNSAIERPVADLFTEPTVVSAAVAAANEPESPFRARVPVSVESAGGSGTSLEMTAVSTEMADGQQVVLILLLDVSERRAAELARDQLDTRLRHTVRSREFLLLASDILLSAKSYDTMLRELASAAVPALGDLCAIDLIEDGRLVRMITRHADPARQPLADQLGRQHLMPGHSILAAARGSGATQWNPRLSSEGLTELVTGEQHLDVLRQMDVSGYICVPLVVNHGVLGVVTLVSAQPRPPFTGNDVELAEQLAGRLAAILARTRRYDREHHIADELQRSMLTELPTVDGLDLVAHYVAAGQDADVGGDWYDAFGLPDGKLAVVVGDVVGHDLTAVTKMGQLRNNLRTLAWLDGDNPGLVLDQLNDLNTAFGIADLATVIYGTLDHTPGGLTFHWANAGHPPPLLVSADGNAHYLEDPASLILGISIPGPRPTARIAIDPGATLYLYTDGLIERRASTLDRGLDALATLAARHAADPLDLACSTIVEQLGSDSEDDIALVAVRIAGQ